MAHWSENAEPLAVKWSAVTLPSDLPAGERDSVYLLYLPERLSAVFSEETDVNFARIAAWADELPERRLRSDDAGYGVAFSARSAKESGLSIVDRGEVGAACAALANGPAADASRPAYSA